MSRISKLRRFVAYSSIMMLATCVSAFLGGKKADHESNRFITPSAHADVPIFGDVIFGDARDSRDTSDTRDSVGDTIDSVDTDQPGSIDMRDANDLAQA